MVKEDQNCKVLTTWNTQEMYLIKTYLNLPNVYNYVLHLIFLKNRTNLWEIKKNEENLWKQRWKLEKAVIYFVDIEL